MAPKKGGKGKKVTPKKNVPKGPTKEATPSPAVPPAQRPNVSTRSQSPIKEMMEDVSNQPVHSEDTSQVEPSETNSPLNSRPEENKGPVDENMTDVNPRPEENKGPADITMTGTASPEENTEKTGPSTSTPNQVQSEENKNGQGKDNEDNPNPEKADQAGNDNQTEPTELSSQTGKTPIQDKETSAQTPNAANVVADLPEDQPKNTSALKETASMKRALGAPRPYQAKPRRGDDQPRPMAGIHNASKGETRFPTSTAEYEVKLYFVDRAYKPKDPEATENSEADETSETDKTKKTEAPKISPSLRCFLGSWTQEPGTYTQARIKFQQAVNWYGHLTIFWNYFINVPETGDFDDVEYRRHLLHRITVKIPHHVEWQKELGITPVLPTTESDPFLANLMYLSAQGEEDEFKEYREKGELCVARLTFNPGEAEYGSSFVTNGGVPHHSGLTLAPKELQQVQWFEEHLRRSTSMEIYMVVRSEKKKGKEKSEFEEYFVSHEINMQKLRANDPARQFFSTVNNVGRFQNRAKKNSDQKGALIPYQKRPVVQFLYDLHPATVQEAYIGLGLCLEQELERIQSDNLECQTFEGELRLIHYQEGNGNTYIGFFRPHLEWSFRIDDKTSLEFTFLDDDGKKIMSGWKGKVAPSYFHIRGTDTGDYTLIVRRPFVKQKLEDRTIKALLPIDPMHSMEVSGSEYPALLRYLNDGKPNRVRVAIRMDTKVIKQTLAAFNIVNVYNLTRNDPDNLRARWANGFIMGRELDLEEEVDLLAKATPAILQEFREGLTDNQAGFIAYLRKLPKGIGILRGPPGCGKTELMLRTALSKLRMDQRVGIVAPTNELSDWLHDRVSQMVKDKDLNKRVYRVFANTVDKRYIEAVSAASKPANLHYVPTDITEEFEVAYMLQQLVGRNQAELDSQVIPDRRLREVTATVGWRILQDADIVEMAERETPVDPLPRAVRKEQVKATAPTAEQAKATVSTTVPPPSGSSATVPATAGPSTQRIAPIPISQDVLASDDEDEDEEEDAGNEHFYDVDEDFDDYDTRAAGKMKVDPNRQPPARITIRPHSGQERPVPSGVFRSLVPAETTEEDVISSYQSYLRRFASLMRKRTAGKLEAEELKEMMEIFTALYHHHLNELTDVYIGTRVVLCRKDITDCPIDTIMIDESQFHLWIDFITILAYFPQREYIILGDENQINASPPPELSEGRGYRNRAAVLGKLSLLKQELRRRRPCYTLTENMRSSEPLVKYLSDMFYGGKMTSGQSAEAAQVQEVVKQSFCQVMGQYGYNITTPVIYLDIRSTSVQMGQNASACNFDEAKAATMMVNRMLANGWNPADIQVLTGYQAHKKALIDCRIEAMQHPTLLGGRSESMEAVAFNTIHEAMGTEKKIVILCLTRHAELGFLTNENIMVTALTRAKAGIIILGSITSLMDYMEEKRMENRTLYRILEWGSIKNHAFKLTLPKEWRDLGLSSSYAQAQRVAAERSAHLQKIRDDIDDKEQVAMESTTTKIVASPTRRKRKRKPRGHDDNTVGYDATGEDNADNGDGQAEQVVPEQVVPGWGEQPADSWAATQDAPQAGSNPDAMDTDDA